MLLILYSSMKKKFGKIRIIFDIENWLWKSELCNLHGQIYNQALICQRPFKVRKCFFPFNLLRIWCGTCWKILKWYLMSINHYCIVTKIWPNPSSPYFKFIYISQCAEETFLLSKVFRRELSWSTSKNTAD